MKKQMITMTAALMSLCLTACGSDPVNINVSLSGDTTTTVTTEITSSETTADRSITDDRCIENRMPVFRRRSHR